MHSFFGCSISCLLLCTIVNSYVASTCKAFSLSKPSIPAFHHVSTTGNHHYPHFHRNNKSSAQDARPLSLSSEPVETESEDDPPTEEAKPIIITNMEDDAETSETDDEITMADIEKMEIPPAGHMIEVEKTPNNPSPLVTLTINLGDIHNPNPIIIQTGKIGRQAAGAVTLTRGTTVLYATAAREDEPKIFSGGRDFLPLSVEHQERFSSAGMTSGSYNKRDGRPAEHEILTCRLIDRPIRPLIREGWTHDTQLLSWVLSYDGERNCDSLAITASAAALWISDVPLIKPVAGVEVGLDPETGEYFLNPTNEQMEKSPLTLIIAGTKDAVLMIEGAADFLPESKMMEAVTFGHQAIQTICIALEEFGAIIGKEKKLDTISKPLEEIQNRVDDLMLERVDTLYNTVTNKDQHSKTQSQISKDVITELEEEYPEPEQQKQIKQAFKKLLCRRMFHKAKSTGLRIDGRKLDEVRNIDVGAGFLPNVHGSALFTRGETQAIATATLGDSGMKQKIDSIAGLDRKRFYLQYTFPPSCVGETGRVGMPGRREVGHGNLAERALIPSLPTEEEFPYSIRVESLITESHGSSSMASVCGGSLALMDAGVPVKAPIAGIAMGMLLDDTSKVSDNDGVIISDILGTEDALGTMDFKVAGDRAGITTFQLDIKCEGLTLETMETALEQARLGRIHILDEMAKYLDKPREELPSTVPKVVSFKIDQDSIGTVIGPGGKQIRAIIEDFGLTNMDVQEDGKIQISSMNTTALTSAETFTLALVENGGKGRGSRGGGRGGGSSRPEYSGPEPEVGAIYKGKITGIHQFGVFVEILPGAEDGSTPGLEGLCHVSELHVERVRNCERFMESMGAEEIEVKLLGKNEKGKYQLSRKAVLQDRFSGRKPERPERKVSSKEDSKDDAGEMSEAEVDVIAKAIEGI